MKVADNTSECEWVKMTDEREDIQNKKQNTKKVKLRMTDIIKHLKL